MSKRALKSDDVDGFILALWDEVKDTERLYHVSVDLTLRLPDTRGGLRAYAHAYERLSEPTGECVAYARVDWPTDKAISVHAWLYRLGMLLNVEVQKWHQRKTGEWYSSPTD